MKEHRNSLKSSYAPPLGKSLGIKSELNRTLLEARHHRSKLQTFDFFQGEHFEDVVRKHAGNPKALAMEMRTLPFANVRWHPTLLLRACAISRGQASEHLVFGLFCSMAIHKTHGTQLHLSAMHSQPLGHPLQSTCPASFVALQSSACCGLTLQEGARQAVVAAQAEAAAQAAVQAKQSEFRSAQLGHDKAMRAKAAEFDRHVSKVHAASQARHAAMHAADSRVQQSLAQKAAARKQLAKAAAALDVSQNIDAFEEKLARMAVGAPGSGAAGGPPTDRAASPTIKATGDLPPVGKTPYDQAQRIRQFLPDQERLKQDAQVHPLFCCSCI